MIKKAVDRYLNQKGYEKMNLQAVMFDMDGVLYDSMKNHAYAWNQTMAHFGLDLPEWEAYMHEGRTGASTINIVSLRQRGYEATQEEIDKIYQYKSELFNSRPEAEPMPGALNLLKKVKNSNVTPMVVTGSGQKTLLSRLEKNFPGIFRRELMVTAFDVKYGKPNPEPYLMGMEKYHTFINNEKNDTEKISLAPNNFIVVENAPLGVQAGVAAGVFTIAVNTGPIPNAALFEQGANLLFPSMQTLCDNWEKIIEYLKN
ncbi:MAG: HAD hydrolase-like protein [Bacteroidaceae bacterium]|nr:HAD hydrolase-like protein [Bacteroidaceae bacterium]